MFQDRHNNAAITEIYVESVYTSVVYEFMPWGN